MADEPAPRQKREAASEKNDENLPTRAQAEPEKTEDLSQRAQAERSLASNDEPLIVKTVLTGVNTDDDAAVGAKIVRSDEGEEILASNGLPYQGVSEDWVLLAPKD